MTSADGYAVDVHGLTKIYGKKTVVDHIDIRIPRGKVYGFLGPNGSGKTTTIRMICGLLTPDAGEGTCLGADLRKEPKSIKRRLGYMTQKFSFWDDMTVTENLAFVADMFGLDNPQERVQSAIEKANLTDYVDHLAGSLSGGWKQRLALAACTLHDPELLLLDEPTAGVDPQARREFWDEIHRLAAEGLTVLVSTHYMDEAERCHAIIYLSYGHIVAQGTVDEVIAQAGLTAWDVRGGDLTALMDEVGKNPAVTAAAIFGDILHVSGPGGAAFDHALASYRADQAHRWERAAPSLEDAFIRFTEQRLSKEA
ncbi:MAG: ABC transporter ATP-binding protein [Alphaproteobacteria bacterium]|nr:ABC transporter ATP-binding protein [Alphaproteobacteria bacterium]